MNRFAMGLCLFPLMIAAGCSVTEESNGSSTISIDENRIAAGADAIGNEAAEAADVAVNKIENAGPEIENSAAEIKDRASRVADKAEALGNRVEERTDGDTKVDNSAR
jgi:hypothetical protein